MKRKTVSLCMIARNEEASIGQAIKSALAVVDEIIVGDTGSDDNTRLIAEGYGAKVIDVPWDDDFAAARNSVLDEASCDWVLILDADERLQPVRPVEFQKMLAEDAVSGYKVNVVEMSETGQEKTDVQTRVYRNHPYVRYCYPIHETIDVALENWSAARELDVAPSRLRVVHASADHGRATVRIERNRRLLRDACREYPYEPYFAYCLASESLSRLDGEVLPAPGLAISTAQMAKAWHIVEGMSANAVMDLSYGPHLAGLLSACYIAVGQTQKALDTVWSGLEIFPDSTYLLFRRAVAIAQHLERGDDHGLTCVTVASLRKLAEKDLGDCLASAPKDTRDVDERWRWLLPHRYLASLRLLDQDIDGALVHYTRSLELDQRYSHGWSGKAECVRRAGEDRRALGYYLRAVTLDDRNLDAWLRGGEILEILGFTDNARSWRRRARELFPEHPAFQSGRPWLDDLVLSVMEPTS